MIVRGVTSSMRQASAATARCCASNVGLLRADEAEAQRVAASPRRPWPARRRPAPVAPGRRRCGWCGASGSARTAGPWARAASATRRMRRHRPRVQLVRAEGAFGKERDLGALAALARGDVQQLDEGAVAHHDLARVRVGLGQQALQVAAQQDLVRARSGPPARTAGCANAAPGSRSRGSSGAGRLSLRRAPARARSPPAASRRSSRLPQRLAARITPPPATRMN